jgi:hypothetical protein
MAQDSKDLFGEPIKEKNILVFHDESGDYGHNEWIFTGLLWICEEQVQEIDNALKVERRNENYEDEVHFSEFPASFDGDFGAKPRVARRWFNIWKSQWADKTWFNVLAVNTRHPSYDRRRFTRSFHAYNRFTAMALKAGVAWHFADVDSLRLLIYSDEKSRRPQGLLGDGITTDNFETYLARRLPADTRSPRGPTVCLGEQVKCLSCPKRGPYSAEQECIQLADLLLGAVATAVERKSDRQTKLWFGREICKLIQDVRVEYWKQTLGLHRRFSVSYFPNNRGEVYTNGPLKISEMGKQLSMFEFSR